MGNRPDKKQIKALLKRTKELDSWLKIAIDSEKEEIAELRRAADLFISEKRRAELESMDVELLAQGKQGIRVSYLKAAGIQNMYQLSGLTCAQIEALDGIGAQGAVRIHELTKQIVKNTRETMSVRIDADNPSKADDTLVSALYRLILHTEQRDFLQPLYEQHHKALTKELAQAQKICSGFSWFFASKQERETSLAAVDALRLRLEGEFGDGTYVEAYEQVSSADITACYAHFRENAARHYAALETYCKQLDIAQTKEMGLPEELVKQIEGSSAAI